MILTDEYDARQFCAARGDAAGMERLEAFAELLLSENKRQNLIAKASEQSLWLRHFADSAQLLDHVPRGTEPWLDLGTGAGLPGIVIACLRPELKCVLVESRRKRADFLSLVTRELGLANCVVMDSRVELIRTFEVGVISARAFAPLGKLLSLSVRFSTQDTHWLLPKGRSAGQELAELPVRHRKMFHVEQSVTDADAGILLGKGRPS